MQIQWRGLVLIALSVATAACGGGGGGGGGSGGNSSSSMTFSTSTLEFQAASPSSAIPAPQKISATVSGVKSGTLYVLIQPSGPAIQRVGDLAQTSSTTGEVTVEVNSPALLGKGLATSTITVTACVDDPTCNTRRLRGTPKTITVNYRIGSPVQVNTIMPAIVSANAPGAAIIRGAGLSDVTGVDIGSVAATSLQVIDESEIRVQYPGLPAGSHAVHLRRGTSSTDLSVSVTAVDPAPFAAASWTFPAPSGFEYEIAELLYDPLTKSLLVAGRAYTTPGMIYDTPSNNVILRYTYTGSDWQLSVNRPFPDLRTIALTPDGHTLLAASNDVIERLDPQTLQTIGSSTKPAATDEYALGLAMANDGNVVVTTGMQPNSGGTRKYLYSLKDYSFALPSFAWPGAAGVTFYGTPGASADGSMVLVAGAFLNDSVDRYRPGSGKWDLRVLSIYGVGTGSNRGVPRIDERGSRTLIADTYIGDVLVLDGNLAQIGRIAGIPDSRAITRDGTRVYTITGRGDLPPCEVHAYDVSTPLASANDRYPEVTTGGFPFDYSCVNGFAHLSEMKLSQDERTLFVAGGTGLRVIPLP